MSLAQRIAAQMLASRASRPATAKVAPKPPLLAPQPRTSSTTARVGDGTAVAGENRPTPRVVPTPPRHRSASYNPPRREEPDIRALVETFAPPPPPVEVPPAVLRPGARGSCKAVDAATGRTCKLPSHPEHPDQHRHERGPFHRLLAPGEVPPLRQALDLAALAGVPTADRPSDRQIKRESRERLRAGVRMRAHKGDLTSEDHSRRDAERAHERENGSTTHTTEAA